MKRPVMLAVAIGALAFSSCQAGSKEGPSAPPVAKEEPILPPQPEPGEAVKLVRTLQLLQDQIARGRPDSEGARRALIEAVATRLLEAPGETWADTRNVHAALVYVLSGGTPAVLDRLPELDELHERLIAAVRAEAMGSGPQALSLWDRIDPATLPQGLVAPAALAKATWLIPSDPHAAAGLLDLARLNAPGTLIEEAATRRGIEVAAKLGDMERFERLSIRYATRFPRSMYAEAFRARFAEFYLAVARRAGDETASLLDNILASLPVADRSGSYLDVARLALIEGEIKITRSSAERALTSALGPRERARAEFYLAAALALVDDPAAASLSVASVDSDLLDARDHELIGAVMATLDAIHAWPEVTEGPPIAGHGESRDDDLLAETSGAIAEARAALSAAERLVANPDRRGG